jgi:hypothetical protein
MKVGNSWRVGPDHLPVWWTPPFQQDPGQGQGTANIIEHMAGLSSYAGPGGWYTRHAHTHITHAHADAMQLGTTRIS